MRQNGVVFSLEGIYILTLSNLILIIRKGERE
jgi:hypothetical protein